MKIEQSLTNGTRVTVLAEGGWRKDFKGLVCGAPETIRTKQGNELAYWIEFDEPQHDLSEDGPYQKAQVLRRYISSD